MRVSYDDRIENWFTLELEECGLLCAEVDRWKKRGRLDMVAQVQREEETRRKVLVGFLHAIQEDVYDELIEGLEDWYEGLKEIRCPK